MNVCIENAHLHVDIDPQTTGWRLTTRLSEGVRLHARPMQVCYRVSGLLPHSSPGSWPKAEATTIAAGEVRLDLGEDANGLSYTLTFSLPEGSAGLRWRLKVVNRGSRPVYLGRLELLRVGGLKLGSGKTEPAFFSNGWQSWSYSAVYTPAERMRRTRLGLLQRPVNENPSAPRRRRAGVFTSEMFGVLGDRLSRQALLVGYLSQREHFGTIEADLQPGRLGVRMWAAGDGARLDPGMEMESDWACVYWLKLDDPDPLGEYLQAVAEEHGLSADSFPPSPTGWCSWYHYYQEITPAIIRENLAAALNLRPKLPLEVIQIDDGFEAQVGDWLDFKPAFAEGLAPLAAEIRGSGLTPGLWLAPFIVHPRARLRQEHPEWLLCDRCGLPVNAGFLWNTFTTALDLTHPAAQAYVAEVIETAAQRWGYPYLKLDFLYAAALPGRRHDPTRSRAQTLQRALEIVRAAAGEATFLLGCGCPLGTAIGLVDAMRISADVDVRWKPAYHGIRFIYQGEPHVPAVRNALQNIVHRAALHRRWWINDPDCLLARADTELSLVEVQTLASAIALSGGSLLISDELAALGEERLRIAQALFPPIGERPRVLDWFDAHTPRRMRLDLESAAGRWHLLALFNWDDRPTSGRVNLADFGLAVESGYFAREFWSGKVYTSPDGWLEAGEIPPHGVCVFAVRRDNPGTPLYLGSNLHISQGLEASAWEAAPGELSLRLTRPGRIEGQVELILPGKPRSAWLNGQPLQAQPLGERCYRLDVAADRVAEVRLALALN